MRISNTLKGLVVLRNTGWSDGMLLDNNNNMNPFNLFTTIDNNFLNSTGKASSPDLQKWLKPVGASISPYSTNIFGHINKDSKVSAFSI